MRRSANTDEELVQAILDCSETAMSLVDKLEGLSRLRARPELATAMDRALLEQLLLKQKALQEAQHIHRKLESALNKFNAPPLYPATFLRRVATPHGERVLVQQGATRRLVTLADGLEPQTLQTGQEVYIGRELTTLVALATDSPALSGDICLFERRMSNNRLVVKVRDEETVVLAAPALLQADLHTGDRLLWHRDALVAFEKIDRPEGNELFLLEQPRETFADIGGLDAQIQEIQRALLTGLKHPDKADAYLLARVGSILLVGPSGTGKTLIAKALANWLASLFSTGQALFMNIKPGALHSVWYSQSEANYREIFRVAREASRKNQGAPVVLFFDEIDSIGASRGQSYMRINDNVLLALLAELDGVENRGNVVVIAATNRPEALDPALVRPGRMGDWIIQVPRPNAQAAHDILCRHLPERVPFATNGHGHEEQAARLDYIHATVSRLYSPNGASELATLTFRDGKRQPVRTADLVNGALLANIARRARMRACYREIDTGRRGVSMEDLAHAAEEELESASRLLTPGNCRHHLTNLPQDNDVVRVERISSRVTRPQRYLRVA